MNLPLVALTMGDPAGVGPEICLNAIIDPRLKKQCRLILLGDKKRLLKTASHLSRSIQKKIKTIPFFSSVIPQLRDFKESVFGIDFNNVPSTLKWGIPSASSGKASGEYIESAINLAMNGDVQAIVTGPINKVSFWEGGWGKKYKGHTEMLAALTHSPRVALLMVYQNFRVSHVTSHIPLREIPRFITQKNIFESIGLTHRSLLDLGISRPKIGVCGLNPHAGDGGVLGKEEIKILLPAIRKAREKGFVVSDPISADALWPAVLAGEWDVGVAMYHDQGQIPIKLLSFKLAFSKSVVDGVNVTLGLPIIRTSVAHGTAYDIAGKGIASDKSLLSAIELALRIVNNRKKRKLSQ